MLLSDNKEVLLLYHFSSIYEDPPDINTDDDDLPEWKVLPGASQCGGNLLVDWHGYSIVFICVYVYIICIIVE